MSHEQKKEKVPGWELSFFNVILMLVVSASLALGTALYLHENNVDRVPSILLPFIVFFLVLGTLEFYRTSTEEKDWNKWRRGLSKVHAAADRWADRVWEKNTSKRLKKKALMSLLVGVLFSVNWVIYVGGHHLVYSVSELGTGFFIPSFFYNAEAGLVFLFSSIILFFVLLDR